MNFSGTKQNHLVVLYGLDELDDVFYNINIQHFI